MRNLKPNRALRRALRHLSMPTLHSRHIDRCAKLDGFLIDIDNTFADAQHAPASRKREHMDAIGYRAAPAGFRWEKGRLVERHAHRNARAHA